MKPRDIQARPDASIEAQASHWLARRDAGLRPPEEAEFAAWRAQDPRHEAAFQRFEAMSAALCRARQSGAMTGVKSALEGRARRRRARRIAVASVAAVLLGVFASSFVRRLTPTPIEPRAMRYIAGTRHLPDGSTAELNAGAELAIHYDAAVRRVELVRGEALFHVAKDANHPFIVRAGDVDVRAVGTAFSVRLDPRQVEVLVTEGKVGVNDATAGRSLLPAPTGTAAVPLVAGERAVMASTHPTLAAVTTVGPAEIARRLAWRSPRILFDGTDLTTAVQTMNERNTVQIVLAGDSIGDLHISGSFSANDPRTFAQLAAATFGLSIEEQNGTIVLH